ncbi:hypothetical protein [Pseudofrankia asymbiotica]|uniref:Teneurin NHL domain-containing protein n=1 Tax=Pseudofrankia asymbiotica TaxID=1834516 RepID=A0A1V2I496_9ACTN|nr:hypothetical protein [Pseudofrankia asymbiotica]ONH25647.1 hypothetical protein BL253_26925 [Pseudofrankia asymbiotica]
MTVGSAPDDTTPSDSGTSLPAGRLVPAPSVPAPSVPEAGHAGGSDHPRGFEPSAVAITAPPGSPGGTLADGTPAGGVPSGLVSSASVGGPVLHPEAAFWPPPSGAPYGSQPAATPWAVPAVPVDAASGAVPTGATAWGVPGVKPVPPPGPRPAARLGVAHLRTGGYGPVGGGVPPGRRRTWLIPAVLATVVVLAAAATTVFIVSDSDDSSAGTPAAAGTVPAARSALPTPTRTPRPVPGAAYAGKALTITDFAPDAVAVSRDGTLYVSSNTAFDGAMICQIGQDGDVVNTYISPYGYDDDNPIIGQVDFDDTGNVYYSDMNNYRINKIAPEGRTTTVAGTGVEGFSGDGGPATEARIGAVDDLAVLPDGTIYFADFKNERIRKVTPDGVISTVIHVPAGGLSTVEIGPDGSLYFTDLVRSTVNRLDADGGFTVVAGGRRDETADGRMGEGGPALKAGLFQPILEVGPDGTLYVVSPAKGNVRKIGPDGIITTVAGTDQTGFGGDGGPAVAATLWAPHSVVIDSRGALYVAEIANHRIRRIGPDGIITTIAKAP